MNEPHHTTDEENYMRLRNIALNYRNI